MNICIHCFVSGRVQGVWFRASTKRKADELGLGGWVQNLSDGRVEVMASGDEQQIEALFAWLKHGPELAEVTHLSREDVPYQLFSSFETI